MKIYEMSNKCLLNDAHKKADLLKAYGIVSALKTHIGHMVLVRDEASAEEGLKVMARFYEEGSQPVKTIVENTFIFSLGSFIATCAHRGCLNLIDRVPENL